MTAVCTVCSHARRVEIDAEIVAGVANRRIASRFGLSEIAIRRHKAKHLPGVLELNRQEMADTLTAQVQMLHAETMKILARAQANNKDYPALRAIEQARGTLSLMAELLGKINTQPQINILVSPQWITLRGQLIRILAPYPEAIEAIAALSGNAERE